MSLQQQEPAALSVSHDPDTLNLPPVPRQDLPFTPHLALSFSYRQREGSFASTTPSQHNVDQHCGATDGHEHRSAPVEVQHTVETVVASPTEFVGVMSIDESVRGTSVSMDDPDVRMAAEALSGLGNADFLRSPLHKTVSLQQQTKPQLDPQSNPQQQEPEPLLSLVSSKHPWLGGTISGSLSAYSSTKLYSPRFIQYGADLVERNIGSPMANTTAFVVKKTGVEGGIRWYLARPPHELDRNECQKRRKLTDSDLERGELLLSLNSNSRRESDTSFRSLPAYDAERSPEYSERDIGGALDRQERHEAQAEGRHWSTQVWISTSGLGAALSEPGLRTLKFCLKYVRKGFQYVRGLAIALKDILEQWERAHDPSRPGAEAILISAKTNVNNLNVVAESREEEDARIAQNIKNLCDEIWKSLRNVCDTVSQYGGALPENASALVRGQLLSVPLRWRRATSETSPGNSLQEPTDPIGRARRMLAFAKEGLDMMIQVSGVIEATVDSAERWLDSMGRRKRAISESSSDEVPDAKDQKMMNGEHARNASGSDEKAG